MGFGMTRHICNVKTDMRLISRIYNIQSSDPQQQQKDSHPLKKMDKAIFSRGTPQN